MVCMKRLLSGSCDSRAKNNVFCLNNVSSVIQTDKSQRNLKGPCQIGSKNNPSQLCFGEWACVLMCYAPSALPVLSWVVGFFLKQANMTFELCHLVTQCMKLLCSGRKGLALAWERAPPSLASAEPHLPEGGEKLLVWDLASQKDVPATLLGIIL